MAELRAEIAAYNLSDVRPAHTGQAATPQQAPRGAADAVPYNNASKALAADVRQLSP
ncbi:MAG: hypothetical protein K0R17_2739 [Rariglobus sp.]|jgi:hypothetical protein|nr:hypothetical protein [Rariglobus sp.]